MLQTACLARMRWYSGARKLSGASEQEDVLFESPSTMSAIERTAAAPDRPPALRQHLEALVGRDIEYELPVVDSAPSDHGVTNNDYGGRRWAEAPSEPFEDVTHLGGEIVFG